MELQRVVIKAGNAFDYSPKDDIVEVHYTGWLYQAQAVDQKGREFIGSRGRGVFCFVVGTNKVIKGWDILIPDMSLGEKPMLHVPRFVLTSSTKMKRELLGLARHSQYGYRSRGLPGLIPPDTHLLFEVELVTIVPQDYSSSDDETNGYIPNDGLTRGEETARTENGRDESC